MTPDLGIMTEEALAELLGLELATMANRRTKGELPAHIKPRRRVRSRLRPTSPAATPSRTPCHDQPRERRRLHDQPRSAGSYACGGHLFREPTVRRLVAYGLIEAPDEFPTSV